MPTFLQFIDPYLPLSGDLAALLVLLVAVPLVALYTLRARRGWQPETRALAAYSRLEHLVSQAAESGRPLHVALGTGQLGTADTVETLMGLTVLDYVARRAAVYGQPVLATTGDPATLAAAQGVVRQALVESAHGADVRADDVAFFGPEPLAYAAGAYDLQAHRQPVGAALWGAFGIEGLWLAEAAARPDRPQVGGTAQPASAALLQAPLDENLSGEEVFAAGAYLHRASHRGSLAAQDVLRGLVIAAVVAGVVLTSLA